MGLDMYLTKKKHFYSFNEKENMPNEITELSKMYGKPVKSISFELAYWRKANEIHKWFVDNVQDGNDNCGEYELSFEYLKLLVESCEKVLKDHSLAPELLPTQSGFFFGSTDYDEYYFEDLQDTVNQLKPEITEENEKDWTISYHYQSSW